MFFGFHSGRDQIQGKSAVARLGAGREQSFERGETDAQSRERPGPAADQKGVDVPDLQFFFFEKPVDHGKKVLGVFHIALDRGVAEPGAAFFDRNAQDRAGSLNG